MINKDVIRVCLLIVLLAIGFQLSVFGQQISSLSNGVQGLWSKNSSDKFLLNEWTAQWIWLPDSIQSDVMLARKSFDLKEVSKTSRFRISATSKYELYINETYVCQGPARTASHHQSFDVFDVSSLLKTGKNTIAIRVHYQKGTVSYHLKGRGGLLVQLDLNEEIKPKLISDATWKVFPDLSWDNNSDPISRFQLVVNDRINFNKSRKDFKRISFNDSQWYDAFPLLRNSGWPSPKPYEKPTSLTTPWTSLVSRDMPYLNESEVKAIHLIEARRLENSYFDNNELLLNSSIQKQCATNLKAYQKTSESIVISPSKHRESSFLLFDLGEVVNGLPKLSIEGAKNTKVHVLSAPFMVDGKFTHKIVASNYHDELTLSGNIDKWQAMYFKPARYLALVVEAHSEPVKIHFLGTHKIQYPFSLKGSLSTPAAPWIESLWQASAKTIDVCTTDALTDNYRERRQYAQTGYYAALGNYFSYGDYALQRRCLIQVAQEQEANGLMPAYAPLTGSDYMVILDSNCLWIRSLYNYLLYSGDYLTVKELLPSAKKLMSLLNSFTNNLGMIDSPPYSYWLDHALNDRQGANLCLNGHYLGALQDFAKILECTGNTNESLQFNKRATLLKESLGLLWDEEKGLFADAYIDGKRSKSFSEHGNAMALAFNIATNEQGSVVSKKLLEKDKHNYIKRESGLVMVTPAMSYFLHKGLANYGYEEASLNMLNDRFKKMLTPGANQTLWEEWWRDGTGRTGKFLKRTRSDAQTESAFHPGLFAEFVLGVKVTQPGMKEIYISKPVSSLNKIDGTFPSPSGLVGVKWHFSGDSTLILDIPQGCHFKIDINSLKGKNDIILNGKDIERTVLSQGFLRLGNGNHEIKF